MDLLLLRYDTVSSFWLQQTEWYILFSNTNTEEQSIRTEWEGCYIACLIVYMWHKTNMEKRMSWNKPPRKEQFCQVMPFILLINIQSNSVGSLSMVSLLGKSHWLEKRTPLTFLNENSMMLKIIGGRTISTHKMVFCNQLPYWEETFIKLC